MWGKLTKHEFLATGRVFLPMYGILLVMAAVTRLFFFGRLASSLEDMWGGLNILRAIIGMLMVSVFAAVGVVTFVMVLRRFWNNLLGREGYLMNVLPVSPWEHVAAKLTVSVVWNILSALFSFAALWIILGTTVTGSIQWDEFRELVSAFFDGLRRYGIGGQVGLLCFQLVLTALLVTAMSVLTAYAAMCVGQLVNRHRVLLSIGAYLGINTAINAVTNAIGSAAFRNADRWMRYNSFNAVTSDTQGLLSSVNQSVLFAWVLCAGFSVILFFCTQLLLKRELNLQ